MRRHRTTSRKQADTRHRKTTKPKRRKESTAARGRGSSIADLAEQLDLRTRELNEAQKKLNVRTRELTESLEQQTAAAEVLRLISSSPGDLDAVFQTLLGNALRLCAADFGLMFQYDGISVELMAQRSANQAYIEYVQRLGSKLINFAAERRQS